MITVETATTEPNLSAYREAWEELFADGEAEPSASFEWTDAMTKTHLGPGDCFVLLRARKGTETTGFLPLVARRVRPFGKSAVLLAPLSERYNTHSDILARRSDGATVRALLSALYSLDIRWDIFRMARVLEMHPAVHAAAECMRAEKRPGRTRDGEASYFLQVPGSYADFLADRSAKFRNHLRRTEKKIGLSGDTRVLEIEDPEDVAAGFEHLLQVERTSWKHRNGTAISAVPRQVAFYRDLCAGAAASGRLSLQVLLVDGAPAAYNLGYISRGRYSYLKTSYDERVKPLGAATYLRASLIQTLMRRGIRELDFPAEPYEWERQWTDRVRWHKIVTLYRETPAGRVLAWLDRLRHSPAPSRQVAHVDPRVSGITPDRAERFGRLRALLEGRR